VNPPQSADKHRRAISKSSLSGAPTTKTLAFQQKLKSANRSEEKISSKPPTVKVQEVQEEEEKQEEKTLNES